MLRKNQFLLLPHVPNRDSSKADPSSSTVNGSETSEQSDLSVDSQNIMNQNFLMETHNNEDRIAMMNENDDNYFEIFRAPMKFGTVNNTEVTAQIGTTAHLPCTIHSIGEGVVSCYCNVISDVTRKVQCAFITNEQENLSSHWYVNGFRNEGANEKFQI